jgi:hypothetical protein
VLVFLLLHLHAIHLLILVLLLFLLLLLGNYSSSLSTGFYAQGPGRISAGQRLCKDDDDDDDGDDDDVARSPMM